jgi:3'(2'), 5'-bisphosphate nucleotidase
VNRPEPAGLLPAVNAIARQAGEAIMRVYGEDFAVHSKHDKSPVTAADLASHHVILDALARLTPGIPVLSEEDAGASFAERSGWRHYWLVDPLDGTKEFVSRNGEFTVNIALISDHVPVLGVVLVPVTGACYFGAAGHGAFLQKNDDQAQAISVRLPHADPIVVVGSRSHANPKLEAHLEPLGNYEMVSMGSSLKCCLVAEGKADFYPRLGHTFEWDTAAAQAVVTAAGGMLTTLDGRPFEYNRKESLLNPEFLVFADTSIDWPALFSEYISEL